MRALVIGIIGAVALTIGWLWVQPDCSGGRVVASEADCREHFSDGFCRTAFARTAAVAARSGAVYTNEAECRENWPICDRREPLGFGPRPSHWCLVRAADGSPARIEPQYNNRRQ